MSSQCTQCFPLVSTPRRQRLADTTSHQSSSQLGAFNVSLSLTASPHRAAHTCKDLGPAPLLVHPPVLIDPTSPFHPFKIPSNSHDLETTAYSQKRTLSECDFGGLEDDEDYVGGSNDNFSQTDDKDVAARVPDEEVSNTQYKRRMVLNFCTSSRLRITFPVR
jgi:hypothetical protein